MRYSERSDVELLSLFKAGEERAFAELYNRYKAEIYTFCLRMLGGNTGEAGDAFQESFSGLTESACRSSALSISLSEPSKNCSICSSYFIFFLLYLWVVDI